MTDAAKPSPGAQDTAENTPGPAGAPPEEELVVTTPARRLPRTAATLRIFGALLWAYIVLGEWVIGLSFPEPLAVLIVAGVFGAVWFTCVGHGPGTPVLDKMLPGLCAVSLWVLLLVSSSALPRRAEPSRIEAVSASLCFIGAAAFYGASLWRTAPVSARMLASQRWRWLGPSVATAATVLAIVSALNRL